MVFERTGQSRFEVASDRGRSWYYFMINLKGYVPALVLDNGETLTANVAILSSITDEAKFSRIRLSDWLQHEYPTISTVPRLANIVKPQTPQ